MKPWRAIPLQIAGLTVLGITVITAYMYQQGGVVSESPTRVAIHPVAPSAAPMEEDLRSLSDQSTENVTSRDDVAKEESKIAMAPEKTKGARKKGVGSQEGSSEPLSEATQSASARNPVTASAPTANSAQAATSYSSARASASAPTSAPASAPSREPAPALPQAQTSVRQPASKKSEPAPEAKLEPLPMESEAYTGGSASLGASKPKGRVAGSSTDPLEPRFEKESSETYEGGTKSFLEFTVAMKSASDTTKILAGLKAMGAEILTMPSKASPHYRLRITPSSGKDIQPYLERYGNVKQSGDLSSLNPVTGKESAPTQFQLRLLLPAK